MIDFCCRCCVIRMQKVVIMKQCKTKNVTRLTMIICNYLPPPTRIVTIRQSSFLINNNSFFFVNSFFFFRIALWQTKRFTTKQKQRSTAYILSFFFFISAKWSISIVSCSVPSPPSEPALFCPTITYTLKNNYFKAHTH